MKLRLKLKYKKMIFAISLGTMAIGLSILSINTKADMEASIPTVATNSPGADASANPDSGNPTKTTDPNGSGDVTTAKLLKNAYPGVNQVVEKYLEACVKADMTTLQTVVSEIEKITKDELERRYEYIEAITNIDCYTLPGMEEDSYIVYVYHDSKIVDIETKAPGLIALYVTKASDDSYVVMLDPLEDTVRQEMSTALKREDIQDLIQTVNFQMMQAMELDENLKNFEQKLEKAVDSKKTGASASPKASAAPKESASPAASASPKASAEPKASASSAASSAPAAN